MALGTFEDFISNNPKYKKYSDSSEAKRVYNYLKTPENIEKMISVNEEGSPALFGVQAEIETIFGTGDGFSFKENFVKQCVGTMVKDVLGAFGYSPNTKVTLPKTSLYFKSATYFTFDKSNAKYKLAKKLVIEEI